MHKYITYIHPYEHTKIKHTNTNINTYTLKIVRKSVGKEREGEGGKGRERKGEEGRGKEREGEGRGADGIRRRGAARCGRAWAMDRTFVTMLSRALMRLATSSAGTKGRSAREQVAVSSSSSYASLAIRSSSSSSYCTPDFLKLLSARCQSAARVRSDWLDSERCSFIRGHYCVELASGLCTTWSLAETRPCMVNDVCRVGKECLE
jgi:hypothetical protein